MGWKNLSMMGKIFAAIFATAIFVVLTMAVLIALSMRSGFSVYLLSAEIEKTLPVQEGLVRDYDAASGGWPMLDGSMDNWLQYTKQFMDRANPGLHRRLRGGDPMKIGHRMVLQDAQRRIVAGKLLTGGVSLERPLIAADGRHAGQTVGYFVLASPSSGQSLIDGLYLRGQLWTLAISVLATLTLSGIAAYFLARHLVSPLRALTTGTEVLAKGDYSRRMQTDGRRDEVGRLIDCFNKLGDSLEAATRAERQWISDTSHELKTPIAVLRAEIEAIQDGIRQSDETSLATLHGAVTRLADLVEDLNDLSLAREGKLVTDLRREDLSQLVRNAAEGSRGLIEEAGLQLETDIEPGIMADCDARRLVQTISNLLDNSRRYTAAPGLVRVTLERVESGVQIAVVDSAPAPPEAALGQLFDRFYRVDASRARILGGSGLGLAICRSIVEGHKGQIRTTRSTLGGLSALVDLPPAEIENAA